MNGHFFGPTTQKWVTWTAWTLTLAVVVWYANHPFPGPRTGKRLEPATGPTTPRHPRKNPPRLSYSDLFKQHNPKVEFDQIPMVDQSLSSPTPQPSGLTSYLPMESQTGIRAVLAMSRLVRHPCLGPILALLHQLPVARAAAPTGLDPRQTTILGLSASRRGEPDWGREDVLLHILFHLPRYIHAPLCLAAQIEESPRALLKRLSEIHPITAFRYKGLEIYHMGPDWTYAFPRQNVYLSCYRGDVTTLVERASARPIHPMRGRILAKIELQSTSRRGRTRAEAELLDQQRALVLNIRMTGPDAAKWKRRLQRLLSSTARAWWAKKTDIAWTADLARWKPVEGGAQVTLSLERRCVRLRAYLREMSKK